MTNRRSIVMSGDLGSGKSTISRQVASRLGLRRLSMGDLYRNMAQERGMSALQLNLHAERDEAVDGYIDQLQAEIARSHEQLVIDSRLSWFFFSDAFKVYLIVDPVTAARRVMSRPANDVEAYSSVEEAVDRLRSRSNSERIRFIRKYAVDKTRLRNYDMVCDTTRAGPDEIVDRIVAAFNGTFGQEILAHSPPLLLLDPARIYPSQDISGRPGPWDPGNSARQQRAVVEVGQDVPGEQVALGGVRVTGQDERLHAEAGVAAQLSEHLAGIADDGGAGPGARAADASPQVRFGVALLVGHVA